MQEKSPHIPDIKAFFRKIGSTSKLNEGKKVLHSIISLRKSFYIEKTGTHPAAV
jgi:hypothetical protein